MKYIFCFALLCMSSSLFSQADNIDFDGYATLKLGVAKSEIIDLLEPIDEAPLYAWFGKKSFEDVAELMGYNVDSLTFDDTLSIDQGMMEYSTMPVGELFAPKENDLKYFCGLHVAAISIVFNDEDEVQEFALALDKNDVSDITKAQLMFLLKEKLGDTMCSFSLIDSEGPYPFYCDWVDPDEFFYFVLSDEESAGGNFGASINLVISYY